MLQIFSWSSNFSIHFRFTLINSLPGTSFCLFPFVFAWDFFFWSSNFSVHFSFTLIFHFILLISRSFSLHIFAVSLRCETSEIMLLFCFQGKRNFRFNFNFKKRERTLIRWAFVCLICCCFTALEGDLVSPSPRVQLNKIDFNLPHFHRTKSFHWCKNIMHGATRTSPSPLRHCSKRLCLANEQRKQKNDQKCFKNVLRKF